MYMNDQERNSHNNTLHTHKQVCTSLVRIKLYFRKHLAFMVCTLFVRSSQLVRDLPNSSVGVRVINPLVHNWYAFQFTSCTHQNHIKHTLSPRWAYISSHMFSPYIKLSKIPIRYITKGYKVKFCIYGLKTVRKRFSIFSPRKQ